VAFDRRVRVAAGSLGTEIDRGALGARQKWLSDRPMPMIDLRSASLGVISGLLAMLTLLTCVGLALYLHSRRRRSGATLTRNAAGARFLERLRFAWLWAQSSGLGGVAIRILRQAQ
jgi:hypothetical protein